ncbi:hypothetical protein Tco_0791542 [Tanacetum coccineum]
MAALQYKDDHNRIAYLGRERGSEDFTDILSYLDHSPLRYALTHDPPVVFDSLVKQFWATATVRPNAAGSRDLVATIDGREVVVTESLIRAQLQLDDANGIFDMQIDDIFAGMGAIGYPTDRTLTFLKHHLSPQWRFLVHTILHCLSPKAGSWNQFPSSIATALICLSTGRVYNFSRFILEGMIANVKTKKNKFLMYPRFLQMLVAIETADRTPRPTFGFTRKLFSNMKLKWEGEEIPLTPPMLAIAAAGNDADDDDATNEANAAADEAAGSAAEAHPVPHSPPVSPVRELTPERQSASAEPLVFGPEPRPAGYVDPDVLEPIIFGPQPRPSDFVDPDLEEPVIFGPPPRPDNYIEPADIDNLVSMEDDTIHGGFHEESPVGPNDAPTPTADAAGRAEDPTLLTSLSAKLDRCMGRIDSLETELGTSKKIMGGAILTLVSRVKKLERTVKQLRTARFVSDAPATEGDVNIQDDVDLEGLSRMASEALGHDQPAVPSADIEEREEEEVPLRRKRSVHRRARTEFNTSAFAQFHAPLSADVLTQAAISESAGPSVAADKGKAPMPELDIPAEFLAEDAQARQRLEEEQASERLVQRLRAEDLAKEDLPNVSEERAKELDDLMMRMTETDWLNLMMQVGSNPALARELLGADVTEANFVERMTAIKERKKRALADLRYRALKAVKAMSKQQLIEEYEYICRRLEKDRLLSAQYNLFRPKPVISEPPSKRQRVDRDTSQPSGVPAASTQHADDPDSAVVFLPLLSQLHSNGVCCSHVRVEFTICEDSDDSSSHHLSLLITDEQKVCPRVAADPDSDDEVLAEILFSGQYISGAGVVIVDKLPDDEIVDPRVKVETVSDYASSPPRSRRKRRRVRSDDFLCDKPVEDFFSFESESDDDMDTYIPPLPYGAFKDWEIVRCPLSTTYYHVYYQENRRQKSFFYLKQLLPHVYREDLLLLRRRMNRYFRLNPDVDVGLDLWRDVNLLCQSLHSDDVEDFWRTQDEWVVSSWKLYPKSSVHVLDLTNGKTVYMFVDKVYPIRATLLERMLRHRLTVPPSYCRDVVVAGNVIQTVQAGLRESYECLASVPIACTARQMVFSSPWLTAKKESGSPLQTALVCNSNPLMVARAVTNSAAKTEVAVLLMLDACIVAADYSCICLNLLSAFTQSSCFAKIYLENLNLQFKLAVLLNYVSAVHVSILQTEKESAD